MAEVGRRGYSKESAKEEGEGIRRKVRRKALWETGKVKGRGGMKTK